MSNTLQKKIFNMDKITDALIALLAIATFLTLGVIFLAFKEGSLRDKINKLDNRISCLEHPHGASSVAGEFKNGKFVVTQPAHKTGCK